ncbi:MAG: CYTH domain-containing protein, partial [Anaerolineales bacterium]
MEIEAKFSIPDERTFQRLLETSSLAGFQVDEATTAEMTDHYLDTEKRAIQAAGYACRMRHVDGHYVATLKGLGSTAGAIHRRTEYEVEMADFLPPQDWPAGTVRDLALQLCDGEPLVLLFDIEQTRHKRCLHEGSRPVAEVSLDQVRLSRRGAVAVSFSELEAELLPAGTEHDLERLSGELQEKWGLAPETRSKFEQALTLFADQGTPASAEEASWPMPHVTLLDRPGIEPDDAMSEAGRKVLRFHYRRMLYHEPGTRLGEDAEALHDMRVATRRMRAAFRLFGDYFDPQVMAPLVKGLKRTGRSLV